MRKSDGSACRTVGSSAAEPPYANLEGAAPAAPLFGSDSRAATEARGPPDIERANLSRVPGPGSRVPGPGSRPPVPQFTGKLNGAPGPTGIPTLIQITNMMVQPIRNTIE